MSTIIESIEQRQLKRVPRFSAGDRVRVHFQVVEGNRRRTQVFEGVVLARQGSGVRETFTVRKQSFGVGVERTFPIHSPKIERLEVVARGRVRRAKLYYLRGRVGKGARVAERRWGIEEDLLAVDEEQGALDSEGEAQDEVEPEVQPSDEGGAEAEVEADADAEAPDEGAAAEGAAEVPEAEAEEAEEAPEAAVDEAPAAEDAPAVEAEEAPRAEAEAADEAAEEPQPEAEQPSDAGGDESPSEEPESEAEGEEPEGADEDSEETS